MFPVFTPCMPCTTGHKDSVTCAGFSHDAALVATGDMGGMVQVWRVSSKQQIWSFEVGDLEVIEIIKCCLVLYEKAFPKRQCSLKL